MALATEELLERLSLALEAEGFARRAGGAAPPGVTRSPVLLQQRNPERHYIYYLYPAEGLDPQGARESLAAARRLLDEHDEPVTVVVIYAAREGAARLHPLRGAGEARPGAPRALLVWVADGAEGELYAHPGWPLRLPPGAGGLAAALRAVRGGPAGDAGAGAGVLRRLPYLSYGFIALFVAIWLLMELSGGSQTTEVLLAFGAQFNPLVEAGQYWRLISHLFLHIGLAHLIFNTVTLFWVGPIIERLYGRWRFLVVFFLAGLGGGLATFFLYVDPVVSAGASGALFGFFGALAYQAWNQPRRSRMRAMQLRIVWVLVGANVVFGLVHPTVNNAAHMGGLVAGALASALVGTPERFAKGHSLAAAAAAVGLITGGFYVRALLMG